jgi:D-hydroxyproline dehydrogenase subunit beta
MQDTGKTHSDVAVVGAGILGLAHAYAAARMGRTVAVFDKHPQACGASVRNFGMIWPIGQPPGELHQLALRSRELWLELLAAARLPYRPTGSLHLAYREEEADVAREFAARAPEFGYDSVWLEKEAACRASQAIRTDGLLGALFSSTEFTVDPRMILAALPAFLSERYGVQFFFGTPVHSAAPARIETSRGRWTAERTFICSGDDFETLYPQQFAASGLTRCKLQMMRTAPQPSGWQLGPSLAAGLTLRFYPAFHHCPSLSKLRERIASEEPAYDRFGIHALVSQTADGALTLGDSHEYGLAVDPFNKEAIDELILRYTRSFLLAPDLGIAERWYGVYAKHPSKTIVTMEPEPGVKIVASPGGSGMTLAFGMAEKLVRETEMAHA